MADAKLKAELKKLRKKCVKVTPHKSGFLPEEAVDTRFGGPPYAEKQEAPPACSQCKKYLTFVFQFREKYHADLSSTGSLYTVHYCFNCMPIGQSAEEEAGQWRVTEFKEPSLERFVLNEPAESGLVPCSCQLAHGHSLPDYETIETNYEAIAQMCEENEDDDDPSDCYEDACGAIGCPVQPSTCLGGFPVWIQGEGSQECREPHCELEFLAQIDSETMPKLMWGDAGSLYVFRCKEHGEFFIEMQCF
jgi:uncharacterized protein YwqG